MSRNKHNFNSKVNENSSAVLENVEEVEKEIEEIIPEIKEEIVKKPVIKYVNGVTLNVRKTPRIGDNIVRTLNDGEEVKIYEEIEGWARISEEQSEYVMTEFLR